MTTKPGPYVYKPYELKTHPRLAKSKRLYGVSGVDADATIRGLTKEEAAEVCDVLKAFQMAREDGRIGQSS